MKLDYLRTPHTRMNLKGVKDLSVISETIEIPEENLGSKISDIAYRNFLLDISP